VLVGAWEALGQQLLSLEGRLSEAESKTQKQRLSVQQLKEKVSAVCWVVLRSVLASRQVPAQNPAIPWSTRKCRTASTLHK
jgi:hypothetical protein